VASVCDRRNDALDAHRAPLQVRLGGEETVRVAVRQANFDKIAHKVDRMGDYKPEFVFEESGV